MMLSVYLHVWGLGEQKGVLRDADPSSAIRASAPGLDVGSSHPARHRSLEAAGRARAGPGRRGGPAAPHEEQPVARVRCGSRASL